MTLPVTLDHCVIHVSDWERSNAFYRDVLGLEVAGGGENYGTEQEHLNNVFGARLRITALRAARGPGIEFLEYLAPSDGRPRPPDVRANDLIAWQTELSVRDAAVAAKTLGAAGTDFLSPGLVRVPEPVRGFSEALLVADPDGHQIQLVGSALSRPPTADPPAVGNAGRSPAVTRMQLPNFRTSGQAPNFRTSGLTPNGFSGIQTPGETRHGCE